MFLKKNNTSRLEHRKEEESPSLVRDWRSLAISITLLVVVILLCIRYPGPLMWVESLFQWVGLPLHSGENGMGLHYTNIFTLFLIGVVLFFMDRGLNRSKFIVFIVIMMLVNSAPDWLARSYQRVFASGVYAVEVNQSLVSCNYVLKDGLLTGTCQVPITNYSGDLLEILPIIEFPKYWGNSESKLPVIRLTPLLIAPGGEERIYTDRFSIAMDRLENISGGVGPGLIIRLTDGVNMRRWE
ncbi:hypothetical protein [Paenibacillus antarcticus]|uniref:Uncharacterized protein n=1 Tax=Paenibacillus antarcticus TaxID=253703 RepID=A0A168PJ12_9BACL|nr:hypothetical protein [Paenibacillus antarcticus]OAB46809.1 hypothetical protein PBAT_09055 [Paenibacillus antarcticus]